MLRGLVAQLTKPMLRRLVPELTKPVLRRLVAQLTKPVLRSCSVNKTRAERASCSVNKTRAERASCSAQLRPAAQIPALTGGGSGLGVRCHGVYPGDENPGDFGGKFHSLVCDVGVVVTCLVVTLPHVAT